MRISLEGKIEKFRGLLEQLTSDELLEVKKLLDEYAEKSESSSSKNDSLKNLLLNGPTLTTEELGRIEEARKKIDQWRIL
jgi:hypothetical protein